MQKAMALGARRPLLSNLAMQGVLEALVPQVERGLQERQVMPDTICLTC